MARLLTLDEQEQLGEIRKEWNEAEAKCEVAKDAAKDAVAVFKRVDFRLHKFLDSLDEEHSLFDQVAFDPETNLEAILEAESDADAELPPAPRKVVSRPERFDRGGDGVTNSYEDEHEEGPSARPSWRIAPLDLVPKGKAIAAKLAKAGIGNLGELNDAIGDRIDQDKLATEIKVTKKAMGDFVHRATEEKVRLMGMVRTYVVDENADDVGPSPQRSGTA